MSTLDPRFARARRTAHCRRVLRARADHQSPTYHLPGDGSFASPSWYYELDDELERLGYEFYVGALPSASRNPPEEAATLQGNAAFCRGLVTKLSDQGKDVVLVTHSYGGVVGSEAAKGVIKADRQAAGQPGGVVALETRPTRPRTFTRISPPVVGDRLESGSGSG